MGVTKKEEASVMAAVLPTCIIAIILCYGLVRFLPYQLTLIKRGVREMKDMHSSFLDINFFLINYNQYSEVYGTCLDTEQGVSERSELAPCKYYSSSGA